MRHVLTNWGWSLFWVLAVVAILFAVIVPRVLGMLGL
jgi:hypothetical protein